MSRKQKYVLTFMLFIVMNLFLLFYQNYTVVENRQMFISNRLYSTWNALLADTHLQIEDIIDYLPDGGRIFVEHTDDGNIRTFYQNGNWIPPMTSGEFFKPNVTIPQAVIGINVLNNLENDTHFIMEDVKYEIIGILGAGYPSPLDNLILLNNVNKLLPTERIVVDTDNVLNIKSIHQRFNVQNINENQALERFLNSDSFQQMIVINVTIISLLLTVIAGYIYRSFFEKNDQILYLLGHAKIKIFTKNVLILISLFLASLMMICLIDFMFGYQISPSYFTAYIFNLLLIIVIYGINFHNPLKKGGSDA